jgi:hypothetical protein
MYLLIHTHGHIEVSHYAFRSFENTAEGIGMVLWNLQSEDLACCCSAINSLSETHGWVFFSMAGDTHSPSHPTFVSPVAEEFRPSVLYLSFPCI